MDTRETLMLSDQDRAKRYRAIAAEYEAMAEGLEWRAWRLGGMIQAEDMAAIEAAS